MRNISHYEEFVMRFWTHDTGQWPIGFPLNSRDHEQVLHAVAGLVEEVGEVMGKLKRAIRDGNFDRNGLLKEFGDALYYNTALILMMGFTIQEVVQENERKLADRQQRGVLHGEGDQR